MKIFALAGFTVAFMSAAAADATTIGFDDLTGATSYSTAVDVSTRYAALGVTFSDSSGVSGAVQASVLGVTPTSSPNVFFATQHQNGDAGDLLINFTSGSKTASLTTFDSLSYQTYYYAYDVTHTLIDSGSLAPNSSYGAPQFLSLSESSAIYQLALTTHPAGQPGNFGNFSFDDLSFGVSGAVPEPSAWAVMLMGFALVGAAMRRKRAPAF